MRSNFFIWSALILSLGCTSTQMAQNQAEFDDTYVRNSREIISDSTRIKSESSENHAPRYSEKSARVGFYGPFFPGYIPFSPFGCNPYGYYSDPFGLTYGSPYYYGSYYNPYYHYGYFGGGIPIHTPRPTSNNHSNNYNTPRPVVGNRGSNWNSGNNWNNNSGGWNNNGGFGSGMNSHENSFPSSNQIPSGGNIQRPSVGGRGGH
jgi:hypothetical protein